MARTTSTLFSDSWVNAVSAGTGPIKSYPTLFSSLMTGDIIVFSSFP
ncbi:uncharacterized protein METZ01_LOCUS311144, partial [marine metagenome]